ncbi:hypothetical protein [Carboxylicivirga sp. RSCT41]|uniref:hypothetical protein n=1 Tax=Carboxylicivirga agarovorans TaxID=3417570 RepID=UPI003D32B9AB
MEDLLNTEYELIPINDLINIFSQSINGHTRPRLNNFSSEGFFRARKINGVSEKELGKAESIWYPDWNKIERKYHTYNRCSNKGENFFYSSNSLEAVISEMNPKHGDKLLIGIFKLAKPGMAFLAQLAGIERLRMTLECQSALKDYKFQTEKDRGFEDLISNFYTRRVSKESDYKPSIAFTKMLLKNEDYKCLIYPSVAADYRFVNFGIKPEFVDNCLRCRGAYIYNVERTEESITLEPDRFTIRVYENSNEPKNSKFEWKKNTNEEKKMWAKKYCL